MDDARDFQELRDALARRVGSEDHASSLVVLASVATEHDGAPDDWPERRNDAIRDLLQLSATRLQRLARRARRWTSGAVILGRQSWN